MSTFVGPMVAAPSGSSGNNTHASVRLLDTAAKVALVLVVEAAGATPQISWKVQGSVDRDSTSDANAAWADMGMVTAASDSPAAIPLVINPAPAGTSSIVWLGGGTPRGASTRLVRRLRVVTSGAVNLTSYRVECHQHVP